MRIQDFPRPKNDTRRGIHWSASVYHPTGAALDFWINELQAMKMSWVKLLDDGGGSSLALCQRLLSVDIMPVVRLYRAQPNPGTIGGREEDTIRRLVAAGVRYFETNNEPDLPGEWKEGTRPPNWLDIVAENLIIDADKVISLGGLPAFPALAVGNRFNPLGPIAERGRADLFEKGAWIAIHNYTLNHPLDYPYDAVNQAGEAVTAEIYDKHGPWAWDNTAREQVNAWRASDKNPGDTLEDDPSCFLAFHYINEMATKLFGHPVPILTTEGGPVVGGKEDRRYPRTTPAIQAEMAVAITEFMQGARKIHGISCPDNYFTNCHWLIANYRIGFINPTWETQSWYTDWWNGEFGLRGELPVVAALKALPGPGAVSRDRAAVEGCLLRADTGAPLADITVTLRQGNKTFGAVVTDAEGAFRFDDLAIGTYDLEASPWGIVRRSVVAATAAVPAPTPLIIRLSGGQVSALTGAVQSSTGAPAATVRVALSRGSSPVAEATTDQDGGFRFERLPAGAYQLKLPGITIAGIALDGWQTKNLKLTLAAGGGSKYAVITKRLLSAEETRGRRLFYGVVNNAANQPLNGIKLEMRWEGAAGGVRFPTVVTGADPNKPAGYYEFLHTPGTYSVSVIQGDHPADVAVGLETAKIPGRERQPVAYEVNFQLQAVASGPGQVDGIIAGAPAGRKVTLTALNPASSRETTLSSAGAFTFRNLPAGKYKLTLQGIGVVAEEIGLAAGALWKLLFPLKSELSGQVAGHTGGLVAVLHAPPAWGWTRQTPIAADGSFAFTGLPAAQYRLVIGEQVIPDIIMTGENTLRLATIDLMEGRKSVIRGQVATTAGVVQKDVPVMLRQGQVVVAQLKTGADGLFRFANLSAGTYTLEAGSLGQVGGGIVLDGIKEHVVNIVWPSNPPRATLQGRVLSAAHQPQANMRVRLLRDNTEIAYAQTDAAGAFRFSGLAAGIYALAVGANVPSVTGVRLEDGANITRDILLPTTTNKVLDHYFLMAPPPAAGQMGHATASLVLGLLIREMGAGVLAGFSVDEATRATRVTLVGDAVSTDIETRLKSAGCTVARLKGDGYAVAAALESVFAEG